MRLRALTAAALTFLLGACATADVAINRSFDFRRIQRVAVIGFSDYHQRAGSGEIVTGAFEQSLLEAGYDLVERAQVAQVLQERKLTGRLDPKTATVVGKLLGVDALLFGRITDLAEPRETVVKMDVVDEHSDPVYLRRNKRVRQGNEWVEAQEDVISGYKTTRVVRKEPRVYTVDGRLGLSARMVYVGTGEVVWSGSDSTRALTLQDAALGLSGAILKSVKSTWPSSRR